MRIVKTILVALVLALFGAMFASGAKADDWNKLTVVTFSQPIEIPGQILPAGTYTIKLVNIGTERHVVQFLAADGIKVVATVLAIDNWRLHPTGDTVIKFAERTGDNPEALKGWFYPGDNFGQEFVYPKRRAIELAAETKEPVPAVAEETTPSEMTTVPIVAETPEQKEVPVTEAVETTPPAETPAPVVAQTLPRTASPVPLIALLGFASLGCAFAVKRFATLKS